MAEPADRMTVAADGSRCAVTVIIGGSVDVTVEGVGGDHAVLVLASSPTFELILEPSPTDDPAAVAGTIGRLAEAALDLRSALLEQAARR